MKKIILIFIALFFIASCSNQSTFVKKRHINPIDNNSHVSSKSKIPKESSLRKEEYEIKEEKISKVPYVVPPVGNYFEKENTNASVERKGKKLKISVENMPLNEFINFVFGKVLKVSYFIDNKIQKRKDLITINMEQPVSYDRFMEMVGAILSRYGIAIEKRQNTFFVIPGRKAKQKLIGAKFIVGRKIPQNIFSDEIVNVLVPFYYVRASSYISIIKTLALSRDGKIIFLDNINSLFIMDKAKNVVDAIKLIDLFDRLSFVHKKAILVRLDYVEVSYFISKLKKILPLEGIPVSSSFKEPGIVLIPMADLNSILAISPKEKWLNAVFYWKDKLDTIAALGNNPRFFVYYPKNRRASDLAKVFSQVGYVLTKTKKGEKVESHKSDIKIVVDQDRNALVVFASPQKYKQIKDVFDKLDTLPKEVLVEVTIAEVTLTDNLQYGIEWYLQHTGKYSGVLQTMGGLGMGSGGLTYSLVSDTQKFKSLLNMFAKENRVNILSSPRLVVLDNHEATINVGTQVPVVTSEADTGNVQTEGTTSLLRNITYRNTGVILNIKPTINSNGILTLNVQQEVSEPQVNNTSKIDSPLILNRNISTSVVLRSGTTLLLGGLIKNNNSLTVNKVPLLGDIPLLGNLFKTTSKGKVKTELIVEITPYILSSMQEAEKKTKHFESLIKWFKK